MRALFDFITLSLICAHATAAPTTLTSTVTMMPIPLTTLTLQPTDGPYPRASGTGGFPKANSTLLSITLNYHTTLSTRITFTTTAAFSPRPNATMVTTPVPSSIAYNSTSIPGPFQNTCTPDSILCDSAASYSLCVPLLTSSTKYISIGTVPNGTICLEGNVDGMIEQTCTPKGTLHCNVEGLTYFSCIEGGLIIVGNMPPETMCLGGTIAGY